MGGHLGGWSSGWGVKLVGTEVGVWPKYIYVAKVCGHSVWPKCVWVLNGWVIKWVGDQVCGWSSG